MDKYLDWLIEQAHEVLMQCTDGKGVILFSGGKDSMVLVDVIHRFFKPYPMPFDVLHVDTGHNYPEVIRFRDDVARRYGLNLKVASVEDAIRLGLIKDDPKGRNRLQSKVLLDAIEDGQYRYVFGGARRDEDRVRAKERLFSLRDKSGSWVPERQRIECFGLNVTSLKEDEHLRVFPLSHWTELDIWRYIAKYEILLPNLYYAHEREVFIEHDLLVPVNPLRLPRVDQDVEIRKVRFRTVGDMSCTAVVASDATNATAVIKELQQTTFTERGNTRLDDKQVSGAMETRKREGYF